MWNSRVNSSTWASCMHAEHSRVRVEQEQVEFWRKRGVDGTEWCVSSDRIWSYICYISFLKPLQKTVIALANKLRLTFVSCVDFLGYKLMLNVVVWIAHGWMGDQRSSCTGLTILHRSVHGRLFRQRINNRTPALDWTYCELMSNTIRSPMWSQNVCQTLLTFYERFVAVKKIDKLSVVNLFELLDCSLWPNSNKVLWTWIIEDHKVVNIEARLFSHQTLQHLSKSICLVAWYLVWGESAENTPRSVRRVREVVLIISNCVRPSGAEYFASLAAGSKLKCVWGVHIILTGSFLVKESWVCAFSNLCPSFKNTQAQLQRWRVHTL